MILGESESKSDPSPKHERLRDHLMAELAEGRLRPGEALPTELELSKTTSMSRNTVRQALAALERGGLIRRVRGRGTFVHESARERLKSGLDLYALVIPETRVGYYPSLQHGFNEAAAAIHNQVIVCDTGNDILRQADAILQLMDKNVAGAAIVPASLRPTPGHQLRPLQDRNLPIVFCHRRVEGIRAPLVSFPAVEVGRLAGRTLAGRGHRRVAYFGAHRSGLAPLYEQGLREALTGAGAGLPDSLIYYDAVGGGDADHEGRVEAALRKMLAGSERPTAVFCSFDSEAELIYMALGRMGVRVPQDLSLMGFGGAWRDGALQRRLSSVTVDEEQVGRKAVELLDEMRRRERPLTDVSEFLLPLSVHAGETVAAAPE